MSTSKKIQAESDFNSAEKTAENILHWIVANRNIVIGIVVVIAVVVASISAVKYKRDATLNAAKTQYGSLFIQQQKTGTLDVDGLMDVYETSTEASFASYAAYQIASINLEKGEYETALEWFDNALAKNPSSDLVISGIYEGKGVAFEATNNSDDALAAYKKAISTKKSNFRKNDIRYKIALLNIKNSKNAEAKAECEAIVNDTTVTPELKQNATNLLLSL